VNGNSNDAMPDRRRGFRFETPPIMTPLFRLSCLLVPSHCWAQGVDPGDEREARDQQEAAQRKAEERAKAPPPAIPGAVTDEETSTSSHGSDLEPTAALFDAINHGDITGAKEALNRGADINGKNELGMSPLDMSIDLSRNDITFLLLSMRNSEAPPVASTELASSHVTATDGGDAKGGRRHGRHGQAVADAIDAPAGKKAKPVRYAADGGAPKPEIGFLGFNGS
jgi:hypothetical protein